MPKRSGESRTPRMKPGRQRPDAGDHIAEEPGPVLQGAAVDVGAPVHLGAEELGEHIPVGAVDLHPVEAGPFGAGGGGDEVLGQLLHLGRAQAACALLGVVRRTDRRRPGQRSGRPHPGVVDLHHGEAALGLDGGGQPGEPLQVVVGEDPELAREALSLRLHMGRAGRDEAEPAPGEAGEPGEVVLRGAAVLMTLRVGQWRQHEAVPHDRAGREAHRLEELCHGGEASAWAKRRRDPLTASPVLFGGRLGIALSGS
jgi:hypothetical protein